MSELSSTPSYQADSNRDRKLGVTLCMVMATFAVCQFESEQDGGFNKLVLAKLGYYYCSKRKGIVCSECGFFFAYGYVYEDHLSWKGDCAVASKGGFSLHRSEVETLALSPPERISESEASEFEMANMNISEESNYLETSESSLLKYVGPIPTKDTIEIKLNLLNSENAEDRFAIYDNRITSFSNCAWVTDFQIEVLARLGYFCDSSEDVDIVECYFCKFKSACSSLRSIFVTHSLFSRHCRPEEFVKSGESSLNFLAISLYKNLSTYNSKWKLDDEKASEAAKAGFRFNPRNNDLLCMCCGLKRTANEVLLGPLVQSSLLIWHNQMKPSCSVASSLLKSNSTLNSMRSSSPQYVPEKDEDSSIELDYVPEAKAPRIAEVPHMDWSLGNKDSVDAGKTCLTICNASISQENVSTPKKPTLKFMESPSYLSNKFDEFELLFLDCPIGDEGAISRKFLEVLVDPISRSERASTKQVMVKFNSPTCSMCLSDPPSLTIVGCGHVCSCEYCAMQVPFCPICRGRITGLSWIELSV